MTHNSDGANGTGRPEPGAQPLSRCTKVRNLLTAFVTNELGEAQASFIRDHLRQCDSCRHAAQQTRKTFELLRVAGHRPSDVPDRLSEDRHTRIMRAYARPVLTWLRLYLTPLAGILIAMILFLTILYTLVVTWKPEPEPTEIGSIVVRLPRPSSTHGQMGIVRTNAPPASD
ncbi:MAG: zf-HC2 domain-containing protein [bacterium]